MDIIGDLALGESFGCLETSNYHPWVKTLNHFLQGMGYAAATRYYPSIEWLVTKLLAKRVMEMQKKHTEFVHDRIKRQLSLKTNRPDFLTPFMKDNPNFENMSVEEIESTFSILIVAGSETTATVLSGIINHLVKTANKRVLQALVSEIRTAFEREEIINVENVKGLKYLDAVINEGLRLCNPAPTMLPRVVPKGGGIYAGHFVPEKVSKHDAQLTLLDLTRARHASPFDLTTLITRILISQMPTLLCPNAGCQPRSVQVSLLQIASPLVIRLASVQGLPW